MAIPIDVFGLFKMSSPDKTDEKMFLLRIKRPGYSYARPYQEDEAFYIEKMKMEALLLACSAKFYGDKEVTVEHISSFEYKPKGEILFNSNGMIDVEIWAGQPSEFPDSIVISMADSENDFLKFVEMDEDLNFFLPLSKIEKYTVRFITENDFDLSSVPKYNLTDLDKTENQ
ncbi:MAG: hypothetical protein HYU69_01010 [Bacteroidetes bacterium]|nr:hypothetical protein [Bacteroidota bacterium]